MKFEVYDYDKVLQENDSATVKEIYVNDRREKLQEIFTNGYPQGNTSHIKKLDENFGWQPVHPKEPIESIMYRAGQASVIDYIKSIEDEEI